MLPIPPFKRQPVTPAPPAVVEPEGPWLVKIRAGVRHLVPSAALDSVQHELGTGGCTCGTERIMPKTGTPVVFHSIICTPMPFGIPEDYE